MRRKLNVKVEREVDVSRLLIDLNEKSRCCDPGMAGYDVCVNKQMLRDAHDTIEELWARVGNLLHESTEKERIEASKDDEADWDS